ncbi:MAG TPA: hypothetical protein VEZ12_16260, partial [Herpetosiphonaceae bacterium]|nr:hypothetical protein [Herpetosiphonaceae bacterium]
MLLFGLIFVLPSGLQPVSQARSMNPQVGPTATPPPGSPSLTPALAAQTTSAGNTIAYEFTI